MLKLLLFISVFTGVFLQTKALTSCSELSCSECCGYDSDLQDNVCHDHHLICKYWPQSEFSILFTSIVIVLLFTIGMPIFFSIVELLFVTRSKFIGLSFAELIITYICLCRCRKRKQARHLM